MGNIIDNKDGVQRRLWAGMINELVEAKLLEKKRHGKHGGIWHSYHITKLGRLWLLNWHSFLYCDAAYLELVKQKKLPRFDPPSADEMHPATRLALQSDWVIHDLDPTTPEFLRVVIGFTNSNHEPLTVLAYGYPHNQLMVDPLEYLIPIDEHFNPPVPFESLEEMQAYLPEATRFRTYHKEGKAQ